jgi:hypothetical protein
MMEIKALEWKEVHEPSFGWRQSKAKGIRDNFTVFRDSYSKRFVLHVNGSPFQMKIGKATDVWYFDAIDEAKAVAESLNSSLIKSWLE